jgi:DNA recombination protein RmuC
VINEEKKESRNKINELQNNIKLLLNERIQLEKNISELEIKYKVSENSNAEMRRKIDIYEKTVDSEKRTIVEFEIESERFKAKIEEQEKNLIFLRETIDKMKNEMILQFKNISTDVVKEQKSEFDTHQKESLGNLLNPLNKQLEDFRKKIANLDKNTCETKAEIKEKIDTLVNQTTLIGNKADNLADALKGDKKIQGNWGELKLINLLEMSGLTRDEDFFIQMAQKNKKGETVIFDCVIKIPGDRFLIVDSKVSIINYEKYVSTDSEEDKRIFIKMYCNDIKNHIEELGKKEYHRILKTNSPDFVFMFLPLENAYLDAIHCDKSLFSLAMKNKVAMITASSLVPVVNMINNLWNIEKQNKNIAKIVEYAERIYDKMKNFMVRMDNIEKSLDNAKKSCTEAKNYLQNGNGNVLKTADEMISMIKKNKEELFLEDVEKIESDDV